MTAHTYPRRVHHPLYVTWKDMHKRCISPNNGAYKYYGARGIRVCERWREFWNFVEDMGERPPGTTLDRIDNTGHYEPSNCRWATQIEQQRNTRNTKMLTYNGETLPLRTWAERIGKDPSSLFQRIKRYGEAGALRASDFQFDGAGET